MGQFGYYFVFFLATAAVTFAVVRFFTGRAARAEALAAVVGLVVWVAAAVRMPDDSTTGVALIDGVTDLASGLWVTAAVVLGFLAGRWTAREL
ncbi:hypothetical protein [Luteipulveratus halotolerans]|uniref:Uncharacterized protein n=1 Tax=Luteipulveratus halotolerans TaxID=1631356 RepID=A0A0L6CE00_9MICO|nr:hypothetical protein [Luteipulveratus halotolerans]KNX35914.1 hypothetical protein VV01_21910 [Luteipulveratus halotolerans]